MPKREKSTVIVQAVKPPDLLLAIQRFLLERFKGIANPQKMPYTKINVELDAEENPEFTLVAKLPNGETILMVKGNTLIIQDRYWLDSLRQDLRGLRLDDKPVSLFIWDIASGQ